MNVEQSLAQNPGGHFANLQSDLQDLLMAIRSIDVLLDGKAVDAAEVDMLEGYGSNVLEDVIGWKAATSGARRSSVSLSFQVL